MFEKDWKMTDEVLDYLEYSLGLYDITVLYNRNNGIILSATVLISKQTPKHVVLKITALETKEIKANFKREVSIHKALQRANKNVCELYQSQRVKLKSYKHKIGIMVLEKLDMDLMDFISNVAFIPPPKIKGIFRAICQAVLECHNRGVYHLDLKPENVLLNKLGRAITDVKLCDFGCSFKIKQQPPGSTSANGNEASLLMPGKYGTLQYLPPESVNAIPGKRIYAEKVDVYSLGVILFVMITKRFPKVYSEEEGETHCLVNSTNGNYYECLKSYNSGCSQSCANLVSWMMQDDPQVRPSVQDVLNHPYFWE